MINPSPHNCGSTMHHTQLGRTHWMQDGCFLFLYTDNDISIIYSSLEPSKRGEYVKVVFPLCSPWEPCLPCWCSQTTFKVKLNFFKNIYRVKLSFTISIVHIPNYIKSNGYSFTKIPQRYWFHPGTLNSIKCWYIHSCLRYQYYIFIFVLYFSNNCKSLQAGISPFLKVRRRKGESDDLLECLYHNIFSHPIFVHY